MDIKKIVKEKGYTMAKVADELGINRVTLAQSLSGNPTLHKLQDVADVLGCSVGDFFRDEMSEKSPSVSFSCPHCGKPIKLTISHD